MSTTIIRAHALCNGNIVFNNDSLYGETHQLTISGNIGTIINWDDDTETVISFTIPEGVDITNEDIGLSTTVNYISYEEIYYSVK